MEGHHHIAPHPGGLRRGILGGCWAGADAVVSVHLSAQMSGTYESAVMAARQAPIPVHTVDSHSVAMGLGFPCWRPRRSRGPVPRWRMSRRPQRKWPPGHRCSSMSTPWEFLRRGGRIGGAAALFGTALRVKPLLQLLDGRVAPLEKARTASKGDRKTCRHRSGANRAEQRRRRCAAPSSPDRASDLAAELERRLPGTTVPVSEIGAVVGAHVGPGTVAVSFAPKL